MPDICPTCSQTLPAPTEPRPPEVSRPPWGAIWWQGEPVCYELVDDCQGGRAIEARALGSSTLMDVPADLDRAIRADAGMVGVNADGA